ncbi:MAG TPA: DUF4157 domain-containing protein [Propionicimonas sp.]
MGAVHEAPTPAPTLQQAPPSVEEVIRSPGRPLPRAALALAWGGLGGSTPVQPGGSGAAERQAEAAASRTVPPAGSLVPAGVRIHTDHAATRAASAVGAEAFTVGRHVVFNDGRYAPASPAGQGLLAHELAHVVQQQAHGVDRSAPMARQPSPPTTVPSSKAADAFKAEFENQYIPAAVVGTVVVAAPSLTKGVRPKSTTLAFDVDVKPLETITLYAVDEEELFETEAAAAMPPGDERIKQSILYRPPTLPAVAGTTTPPPAAPGTTTPPPPAPGVGAGRYHSSAGPIEVLARVEGFGITGTFTKLAVGAASTTIAETPQGVIVIDAGTAGRKSATGPLADQTIVKARAQIKGRPVVDILLTHAHLDHTGLLSRLAAEFEILNLHINLAQALNPTLKWDELRAEFGRNQRAFLEKRFRDQIKDERPAWEKTVDIPEGAAREQRWNAHVEEQVAARLAARQVVKVDLQVPGAGGQMRVVSAPLENLKLSDVEFARGDTVGVIQAPDRATIINRKLADVIERQKASKTDKEIDVDRYATSYVLVVDAKMMLLVLPDLRVNDIDSIRKALKAEMVRLGHTAELRVWDVTHHLQAGFLGASKTADKTLAQSRLSQLQKLTEVLHDLANVKTAKGTQPTDVVAVSAKMSAIDPALAFVLTSMGLEIVPAVNGQDVRLIEAMTAGGRRVAGLAGGSRYAGVAASDPLLRRAHAAVEELTAKAADLEGQAKLLRKKVDADRKQQLKDDAARLRERIQRIKAKAEEYIGAVDKELGPAAKRTAPPPKVEPAAAQAEALRTELVGFDKVVVGKLGSFSDVAVVLLGGDIPADARAELRTIAEVRAIEAQIKALSGADAPPELRGRYAAALEAKRNVVRARLAEANKLGPEAAEEKRVLRDEVKQLDLEVASALKATQTGSGTGFKQRLPNGKLVETRIEVPKQPTKFERGVNTGAQLFGQGMGAVMVYQLIKGETELEERYQKGEINQAEMAVSSTHNAYGMTIGARMLGAVHVGPGEFVILAALDIVQTALHDYDTTAQRNTAVAYSVIRNALSLGLMAAGQALSKTGPWGVIIGIALMFLVDPILERLGVYDWLERKFSFMPDDVTRVTQKLTKLLADYRVVVGALDIAQRKTEQLTSVGASNPEAVKESARKVAAEYRGEAKQKEAELLVAFLLGYEAAKTSYGGLPELDQQRAEFLRLMMIVHGAEAPTQKTEDQQTEVVKKVILEGMYGIKPAGQQEPSSREKADAMFHIIEAGLNLDRLTPDQIAAMPQWQKMDDWLGKVEKEVTGKESASVDWKWTAEKMGELDQMFTNARYRLNPASISEQRATALLTAGTPGRVVYENLLKQRETRFQTLRQTLGATASTPAPGTSAPTVVTPAAVPATGTAAGVEAALDGAEASIKAFQAAVAAQPPLGRGLTAEGIASHSWDANVTYPRFVRDDDAYRAGLFRMRSLETAMRSSIGVAESSRVSAGTGGDSSADRLVRVRESARQAVEERREVKSFLYLDEISEKVAGIRVKENMDIAALLKQPKEVTPLNANEQIAAEKGDLKDYKLTSITNRLAQITSLRLPTAEEVKAGNKQVEGIFKIVGDYDETDLFIISVGGTEVTEAQNVLVGYVKERGETTSGRYGHTSRVEVTPLNAAAIRLFGGTGNETVLRNLLYPATIDDVRSGL